jgi:ABC-type nitrate/sulfonate/bicarbonate transport system substrate-binding protein
MASGAAVALLLAACGGTAAPAASSAPPSAKPAASAAAPASAAAKPSASASESAAAKPAASGGLRLKVAYASTNGAQWPHWLAETTHAWTDRGLTVDMQYLEGDVGTKALVARQIDVLLQTPTGIVTADLNGNLDLVMVASEYNHSQYALMVAPSIKSGADLKGKAIASDRPGTSVDAAVRQLLQQLDLKLTDVDARQVGVSQALVTALLSGQTVAAPLAPPNSFQVEAQGYRELTNLYKIPAQAGGPIVSRARIDELAPALIPFIEGLRQGIQTFNTNHDLAIQVLRDRTKQNDEALLQRTYDFYKTDTPFQADMQPSMEGLQLQLEQMVPTLPAAKDAKPEQFVDTRLLARLSKA